MCKTQYISCVSCSQILEHSTPCSEFSSVLYPSPHDPAWQKAHTTKDASAYIHEIYYHVCQREDCQAKYNGTDATTVKLESAVDGSLKDIMFVVETGKVRGVVTVAETEEGIVVHGV
jgi:hypothetical protein